MSIESLPKTKSGSARVRNLTHYNTEDLIAVIEAVERTRKYPQWGHSVEQSSMDGLDKVMEFREFTGKPRDMRPYGKTESVRQFVMHRRWRTPLLLRVLPPEKLYINPIHSLVQTSDEADTQELLPEHMLLQLVDAIDSLYAHDYRRHGHQEKADWPAIMRNVSVRINRNRKPRSRKQAILARKRELLHKHYRSAGYRIDQVERSMHVLDEAFASILRYAKGMGMDTTEVEKMIDTMGNVRGTFAPLRETAKRYAVEAQQLVDEVA